jgi:hypothetical protein
VARSRKQETGAEKEIRTREIWELGAVTISFIRREHHPQGFRESDLHDMTDNMFFDYTIFGYERALSLAQKKGRE